MPITDVLSIQLYSLRELGSVDHVLDAARAAGFRHVEMIGSHLDEAKAVRAKLDARGLKGSSSHVGLAQLRDRPDAMIEACATLGIDELYMPAVPPEDRDMDAAGWRALGLELGQLADRFEKNGIRLGYHNHDWELQPKEGGKTALDLIFETAGDAPLGWQADIAWLARGGAVSNFWLQHLQGRLRSVHVKDIAPDGEKLNEDGWTDVGHGNLDWPQLWQISRARGAGWMVVEHDKPADPTGFAKRSYDFLANMTL
ncbi:MAG: sugar phosphate isomerase/epimerase family protein [Geminicoccaceae bacterium]